MQAFYYDSSAALGITASNILEMETWRSRAKSVIKKKKIGQGIIADKLGIAQPTVSAKLNGRRSVTLDEINAFADVLGVSRVWLTHGEGPEYNAEILKLASKIYEMPEMQRNLLMQIFVKSVPSGVGGPDNGSGNDKERSNEK